MRRGLKIVGLGILFLLAVPRLGWTQDDGTDIAPGFKLLSNGLVNIGDISAEVYHFNDSWAIAEQHDVFQPDAGGNKAAPTTKPSSYDVTGTFTSESGPFKLTEHLVPGDGVKFFATVAAEKELATNDLCMSFQLPLESFSGKKILLDGVAFTLPVEPAKSGAAHLLEKDGVHHLEIPTANGTLIITGDLNVLVQDDREFGDQRYALRLHFSPSTGKFKESKIEFQMKLKGT